MAEIFISHATADKALVEHLVEFLRDTLGVPNSKIFCSSLRATGVPLGLDFNDYMKESIQQPKLVILLMTESYLESRFSLMEMGAAWAKAHLTLPIVVPPASYEDVSKTLGLRQAWKITDASGLIDLKSTLIRANIEIVIPDDHTWDDKRAKWRRRLSNILKKLHHPRKVSIEEYQSALDSIAGLESSLQTSQEAYQSALQKVTDLEQSLGEVLRQHEALKLEWVKHAPTIMIAESEELIALDLEQLMKSEGYIVVGKAKSEREAIMLGLEHKPQVVLIETIFEDGSSGVEAAKRLQKMAKCSIVFVTHRPELLLDVKDRPDSYLVVKPFDSDDVLDKVDQALTSRRQALLSAI